MFKWTDAWKKCNRLLEKLEQAGGSLDKSQSDIMVLVAAVRWNRV